MSIAHVDVHRHVAGEVRAAFARKRISIREGARRLGVTQPWLHRRVTGEIPFSVGELAAVADLLDTPVEIFYRDRPKGWFRKEPFRSLLAGLS